MQPCVIKEYRRHRIICDSGKLFVLDTGYCADEEVITTLKKIKQVIKYIGSNQFLKFYKNVEIAVFTNPLLEIP